MPTTKTPKTKSTPKPSPASRTPKAKSPRKPSPALARPPKLSPSVAPVAKDGHAKDGPQPLLVDLNGQTLEIKNPGQKVLYLIRKAYLEGSLSVSDNPTPEIQALLNQPILIQPKLFTVDPKDRKFLANLIAKVEDGTIHLFTPSTLLNQPVYDRLPSQIKSKADYDILILLSKIRQVKKLWDEGSRDSYQIINLSRSLRLAKESLESQEGNVFVL